MNEILFACFITFLLFFTNCEVIKAECDKQTIHKLCNDRSDYLDMVKQRCCWVEKNFKIDNRAKKNECIQLDFTEKIINDKINEYSAQFENIKINCDSNSFMISAILIIMSILILF